MIAPYLILVNTVYCTRDRKIPSGTHRNVIGTSVLRRRLATPGEQEEEHVAGGAN